MHAHPPYAHLLSINSSSSLWWTQIIQKWKRKTLSARYRSSICKRGVHASVNNRMIHLLITHADADADADADVVEGGRRPAR